MTSRSRSFASVARRSAALVVVLATASGVATACSSDGRELAEGRAWQTTTTRPLPPTSAPPSSSGVDGLSLSSPDFEAGALAPVDASCAGANVAPVLQWTTGGSDSDTQEWAVSLSDQTDPENPLLLWLVVGIDPSATQLTADELAVADETLNDYGQLGYGNPCIETLAAGRRDLQFRLFSLSQPSVIEAGSAGNESWDRVAALANDSATLMMQIDANP